MILYVFVLKLVLYGIAGIGNLAAVFLFPLLMYYFKLGVAGAAISTVLSQYGVFKSIIFFLYFLT